MSTDLFRRCSAHIRTTEAADLGCDVADWDSHSLVVVPRPAKVLFPEYAVTITSFGTGTVMSVDAEYIDFVRANPPSKHYNAFGATYVWRIAAEIERRGVKTRTGGGSLGFALAEEPAPPGAPAGFRMEHVGREWMDEWSPRNEFHNALGDPDEKDWFDRLARAFVIFDEETGEPAAATAVAEDGNGSFEIGLDVRRGYRDRRLARPVVLEAARWVLDNGGIPYYTCGIANVRSHLVAERCGFRALWTVTGIARLTEGVGDQEV
jgi:RimJ/RimL family protein N-acetyltransferase